MHAVIIGGGIIGITTAWQLRQRGADVTVIEQEQDVACATSRGNAGVIAPGYVTPWAAPGMPFKILKYLFRSASPVIYRPAFDTAQWRWIGRWLRECDLARYRVNKARMQRVAYYSKACLDEFRAAHSFEYGRSQGYLQLFRSAFDEDLARPAMQMLAEAGINHRFLTADECLAIEPALKWAPVRPASGLYLPDDEAGDCAVFAAQLRGLCEQAGVRFQFNTRVLGFQRSGSDVTGIVARPDSGAESAIPADAVVVAAGVHSRKLLAPLGIRIPLYPVKGYSTTLTVANPDRAPQAALMDESLKTAITRMGPRIRVAGTAELGDDGLAIRRKAAHTLIKVMRDWFPDAADTDQAEFWAGLRPMTPDGPPLLGKTPARNLYINLGHGSTGWAMSMGSACAVADLVTGREPGLDLSGLTLERYAR